MPDHRDLTVRPLRLAGACSLLGGASHVIGTVVHSTQPVGCVAEECLTRPMRDPTPLVTLATLVTFVMLVITGAVLLRLRWHATRAARAAAVTGGIGIATLLTAGFVSAFVNPDFAAMPALVLPGGLLVVVGLALTGVVAWKARLLPRWLVGLLVISVLLFLGANEQKDTVLLMVPFGVVWMVAGSHLLLFRGWRAARTPRARRAGPPLHTGS